MRIYGALAVAGAALYALVMVAGVMAMGVVGDRPEEVARQFDIAIGAKDLAKAQGYLCAARKDDFLDPRFFAVGSREPVDVRYDLIASEGDTARVREIGRVKVTLLGITTEQPVDNTLIFKREDGRWRYCPPKT